MNIEAKVDQFQSSFKDLERRFDGEMTRKFAIVSIGMYESVDFISTHQLLHTHENNIFLSRDKSNHGEVQARGQPGPPLLVYYWD